MVELLQRHQVTFFILIFLWRTGHLSVGAVSSPHRQVPSVSGHEETDLQNKSWNTKKLIWWKPEEVLWSVDADLDLHLIWNSSSSRCASLHWSRLIKAKANAETARLRLHAGPHPHCRLLAVETLSFTSVRRLIRPHRPALKAALKLFETDNRGRATAVGAL